LHPLYESLRRSSFIAAGAAIALERLQREGAANWGAPPIIGLCQVRVQHVPGDAAIALALRRVIEHPPEAAPVLALDEPTDTPPELVRRLWLEALSSEVRPALPVSDLLGWLSQRYPRKSTEELVGGFTRLVFHGEFRATFTDEAERDYPTADGVVCGHPLRLETV
jgi:hypothetical protein